MANTVRQVLLKKIARYFKEWDGEDKTAPKLELNIHELRDIASMHTELCRFKENDRHLAKVKEQIIAEFEEASYQETVDDMDAFGYIPTFVIRKERAMEIVNRLLS